MDFKNHFYYALVIYITMITFFMTSINNTNQHLRYKDADVPLVSLVDVFYGTGTVPSATMSNGNQIPITARPFGNNHWTVVTSDNSPRSFVKNSGKFFGIRCTHFASVWIGDYSFFDITTGTTNGDVEHYDMTPSSINVLLKDKTSFMLAPTETGAIMTFNGKNRMVLKKLKFKLVDDSTIVGTTREYSIFKPPSHTVLHVVIKSSTATGFDVDSNTVWKIGTSFISEQQAFNNIPSTNDIKTLINNNDNIWNNALGKITLSTPSRKFYSILYKTLLFPRLLKEGNGKHYSPYSKHGSVYDGEISTDSGFWDSYRAVYPFLHLVYPSYASRILNGWVNSIKESPDKLLVQWASPGKVDSMEGTMGEISIAGK